MTSEHPAAEPEQYDGDDARLGGTEDASVDARAEALRADGIMPDVEAMRADDRSGADDAPEGYSGA